MKQVSLKRLFAICITVLFCVSLANLTQAKSNSDNNSGTAQDPPSIKVPSKSQASCEKADWKKVPIARIAMAEVGNRFTNDKTPYNNYQNAKWCASFAIWVYNKSGRKIPKDLTNSRELLEWFSSQHNKYPNKIYTFTDPSLLYPGDIVVWKIRGSSYMGHTGVVVSVDPCANGGKGRVSVVEGNVAGNSVKRYDYTMRTIKNRDNAKFSLYGFGRWR